MNRNIVFKLPANILAVLITLFCCFSGNSARAQCAISGGNDSVCVGSTDALSSACSGGRWSSLSPAVATVDTMTGVVTGISSGSAIIRYRELVGGSYVWQCHLLWLSEAEDYFH